MKAVNLIPREAQRRGGLVVGAMPSGPGYLVLIALAVALAFVTVIVITDNTIASRTARLQSLRAQLQSEQALAGRLASYQRFAQLAQERAQTVRDILQSRFDWHGALVDLSKVVPSDVSLQSLNATVSPNAGAGSSGGSSLRGAISAPAFDITGCTQSQDDVARLMSRLRTIDGVTRVTLQSSTESTGGTQGTSSTASAAGSGGCPGGPSFHLVVFFSSIPSLAPITGAAGQGGVQTSVGHVPSTGEAP
jgi:Tfp pilus assembly protein PilN